MDQPTNEMITLMAEMGQASLDFLSNPSAAFRMVQLFCMMEQQAAVLNGINPGTENGGPPAWRWDAFRITQGIILIDDPPPEPAVPPDNPASSRTEAAVSSSTVATPQPSINSGVPNSDNTPVSSRTRHRAALRTVVEDDQSMMPTCSGISTVVRAQSGRQLKRARAPAPITPDTSVIDLGAVRLRPTKKQLQVEKSPKVEVGSGRVLRRTKLFEDNDVAPDATMVAAMDGAQTEDLPVVDVPTKRRKKATRVVKEKDTFSTKKKDTVATKKKDTVTTKMDTVTTKKETTVAKKGGAVKFPQPRRKKLAEGIVQEDDMFNQRGHLEIDDDDDDDDDDDAFAGEFSREPGELDRSLSIVDQIESGTLAIEDMDPEDRYLAELFSPEKTPNLNAALRNSLPLILSSSSSSDAPSKVCKGGRVASIKANQILTSIFDSENDGSPSSSSDEVDRFAPDSDDDAYAKRSKNLAKSPYVRKMFAAARGPSKREETGSLAVAPERRKMQYPGIAALPVDVVEAPAIDGPLPPF